MLAAFQYLETRIFQRFPPGIWLVLAMDTLLTIGSSIVFPFLALYLHNERGIPMSLVGSIFLASGLLTGATNLIGGMLSDKFGRRRLMLGITGIGIFSSAALALLIGFSSPVWLIAFVYIGARCISGLTNPTLGAIVADLATKEKLAESFAVVRIGGNVGFAIGPAIGGFLLGFLSYGWLLGISSLVSIIGTILIFLFFRETSVRGRDRVDFRSTLAVAKDKPLLLFAVCSVLLVLSIGHLGSTLSIFTVDVLHFSSAQYGLLLTGNGLVVVLLQWPATFLTSKMSKARAMVLGCLFYVAGWASLGWMKTFEWALLFILVITIGEVTLTPTSSAAVAESAPADKRGRYMGFFSLSQTLGWSMSPFFGGVMLDHFSDQPRLMWGIIASVGVVAAFGFWVWGRMVKPKH